MNPRPRNEPEIERAKLQKLAEFFLNTGDDQIMGRYEIQCEGPDCDSDPGEVVFYKNGHVAIDGGAYQIGDRKSGYAILCSNCGCEVDKGQEIE